MIIQGGPGGIINRDLFRHIRGATGQGTAGQRVFHTHIKAVC